MEAISNLNFPFFRSQFRAVFAILPFLCFRHFFLDAPCALLAISRPYTLSQLSIFSFFLFFAFSSCFLVSRFFLYVLLTFDSLFIFTDIFDWLVSILQQYVRPVTMLRFVASLRLRLGFRGVVRRYTCGDIGRDWTMMKPIFQMTKVPSRSTTGSSLSLREASWWGPL